MISYSDTEDADANDNNLRLIFHLLCLFPYLDEQEVMCHGPTIGQKNHQYWVEEAVVASLPAKQS
jgi:hypothetical protein